MTGPREEHFQAAGFAALAIEELQGQIRGVLDHMHGVMDTIHHAVGNSPQESAANAVNYAAAARNGLEEAIGTLEAAKQEINRYSGGF